MFLKNNHRLYNKLNLLSDEQMFNIIITMLTIDFLILFTLIFYQYELKIDKNEIHTFSIIYILIFFYSIIIFYTMGTCKIFFVVELINYQMILNIFIYVYLCTLYEYLR